MLELKNVWKRYRLGSRGGLFSAWRRTTQRELWALRDVSLRLEPGESVGLIHDIPPAAEIVERIVTEAEQLLLGRRNFVAAA